MKPRPLPASDGAAGTLAGPCRSLCSLLYRRLLPASERWLDEHALNEDGRLPPPEPKLEERFRA